MYPPIHQKPDRTFSFDRLNMLWDRFPQYHQMTVFSSIGRLLEEHESWQEDFAELQEEYQREQYDRFLIQLSWSDLPYRYETKRLIQEHGPFSVNPYAEAFLEQFADLDTDQKACFLFPESCVSQFFVISEVCRRAEQFRPIRNLFPDEEKIHFLAVFDKQNLDDVLLMYHLLYTNTSQDVYGGYTLYDYSLPWYQSHLCEDGIVLRSPWLPDRIAKYQGNLPFYYNPSKTVYVRRNIKHIIENGYFSSELSFFWNLTRVIMPFFIGGMRILRCMKKKTDSRQTGGWNVQGSGQISRQRELSDPGGNMSCPCFMRSERDFRIRFISTVPTGLEDRAWTCTFPLNRQPSNTRGFSTTCLWSFSGEKKHWNKGRNLTA